MNARFVYDLPGHITLQQEAVIARGLRSMFPDVECQRGAGGFLMDIIPLVGRPHPTDPDAALVEHPPQILVSQVKKAFARLLVEAMASPRVCERCG